MPDSSVAAVLITWEDLADGLPIVRIPALATMSHYDIGKIDFMYEVMEEFQDWYEERTGSNLEEVAPESLEKLQNYVYSILESHWDPARILAKTLPVEELVGDIPTETIEKVTKRQDGLVFWLGPKFIGTYNKLISEHEVEADYLLAAEDAQIDDVLIVLNRLGKPLTIEIDSSDSAPEIDFDEMAEILEHELLEAEEMPAYYTEARRRFTPKHAWELSLPQLKTVLYSDDVVARRPLLLDIWPEHIRQIPNSANELHSNIYHEYHTGERAFLSPKMIDEQDLAERHQRSVAGAKSKLKAKRTTSGTKKTVGMIPRLRPVGHSRLGTGELTLIRLTQATTQELRENHPEVLNQLEQPVERLAEDCIIKLLSAQVDLLDIVNNATRMICKSVR